MCVCMCIHKQYCCNNYLLLHVGDCTYGDIRLVIDQRVEYRYVLIMNGAQYVMTFGVTLMQVLCADK